jgi:site-specific recombinase
VTAEELQRLEALVDGCTSALAELRNTGQDREPGVREIVQDLERLRADAIARLAVLGVHREP